MGKKNRFRCTEVCEDKCIVKTKSKHLPMVCLYDMDCFVAFEKVEKKEVAKDTYKQSHRGTMEHDGVLYQHTHDSHNCSNCDLRNANNSYDRMHIKGKCHTLKMGFSRCGYGVWKKVKE